MGREKVKIAMAVFQGSVGEVHEGDSCLAVGTAKYETRPPETNTIPGRWEFVDPVEMEKAHSKIRGH
jgi:hypothetical protein